MEPESSLLLLELHPNSGEPIYQQLVKQIERLIASGKLQANDLLPSVRKVASHFQVNPMTVSKAFSMLEAAGHVTRKRGKGMMVSQIIDEPSSVESRLALLQPELIQVIHQANQLDLNQQQVIELLKQLYGESK